MIGFSGSREPTPAAMVLASMVAQVIAKNQLPIATGCARGIDRVVRNSARATMVFRSSGNKAWQTARRSARMVDTIALSERPRALLAFPGTECPTGLVPSAKSHNCFCGKGSGTWATAAYAAGLGVPLVIFQAEGETWPLPEWGGKWLPIKNGMFGGGYLFSAGQTELACQ